VDPLQTMLRGRLCRILVAVVLSSSASALAVATPAQATDESYKCEGCAKTSGANHFIDEVGGTDYIYTIVYVYEWKYNGGSNYNLEAWTYSETGNHVKLCTGSTEPDGHGETTAGGLTATLSGREANYKNCSIP
jgi:hypothetical protein